MHIQELACGFRLKVFFGFFSSNFVLQNGHTRENRVGGVQQPAEGYHQHVINFLKYVPTLPRCQNKESWAWERELARENEECI